MNSDEILRYLYDRPKTPVAIDTETDGLRVDDKRNTCIGISIAFRDDAGEMVEWYWGLNHAKGKNVDKDTRNKIRYVLASQKRPLYYANVQFDVHSLGTVGIDTRRNPFLDVLTAQMFVEEEWTFGRRGLDELAHHHKVGSKITEWKYVRLNEKGRPVKETTLKWQKENGFPHTTPVMLFEYAAVDARVTYLVAEKIRDHDEWKALPLSIWGHKQKLIRALVTMKSRGVKLDLDLVNELIEEGEAAKARITETLGLNPGSSTDLKTLLIDRLGLPVVKETPGGKPSFAKDVMAVYDEILERDGREESRLIKEYRGWQTAVGLLLRPFSELVSPDGRLRTSYTTHKVVTGRLSSREPNLQQLSKDGGKPWNDRIRKCFIAEPGFVLCAVDYSQLELRVATAYSQEPQLIEIFREGRDIFTEMTATLIEQFRKTGAVKISEGWSRNDTKTLVYSVQYGAGIGRVMNAFGMKKSDAQKVMDQFYRSYPQFRKLNNLCTRQVEETGKLRLWTGRYRHFRRKSDGYKGMNSLIQGGSADIVERVLVHFMEEIDSDDCRLLLQVHDELVFEVREDLLDEYLPLIQHTMADVNNICSPDGEPLFPVSFAAEAKEW